MIEHATIEKPTLKTLAKTVLHLQERVEDLEDLYELREAVKRNADKPGIPWAKMKTELGLD